MVCYSMVLRGSAWLAALHHFCWMTQLQVWPDLVTVSQLLTAISSHWCLSCQQLSSCRRTRGEQSPDTTIFNNLLSSSQKSSHWTLSLQLFCRIRAGRCYPDEVSYGSCISSLNSAWPLSLALLAASPKRRGHMASCNGAMAVLAAEAWRVAFQVAAEMRLRGDALDVISYNSMIHCAKAGGEKGPWRKALQLLLTLEFVLQASPVSYGSAVGCVPWPMTLDLLQRCHRRGMVPSTVVLNNALGAVTGNAPCVHWMRVLQLLKWQPSASPDVISYSSAIVHCESWAQAASILQVMEVDQVQPNLITCNGIMDICQKTGEWQVALGLLSLMSSSEVQADSISYNSAIGACQACGEVIIALSLLAQMRSRRIQTVTVTYNSSVAVCERRGHWRQALWLLAAMEAEAMVPDVIGFSSSISTCGFVAAWSTALALTLEGVEDVFSFNAAISACDKGGQFTSALRLLDLMSEAVVVPDVITFNGIISASGKDRHWRHACALLSQILAGNMSPNIISYNSAINACTRCWSNGLALLSAAVERSLRCDVVGRSSFLGAAPPWRVALGAMDGMNMISCEMLVNACDASGVAFLQMLRLLSTADDIGTSLLTS